MADVQDIVHQIEYRWHDRRDLSPIASTLPPDSLRGWDAWIRTWVRHPHIEGLSESVCYQIQPSGRAALAWRYEDWQASDREDGRHGRPLVSRVLAGSASQLTPEIAIALGRTGLPSSAGPPPGRVSADTSLPVMAVGDLTRLAETRAHALDEEAAGLRECLLPILAAALSDPDTPIAVYLGDSEIFKPPDTGVQCPLLWGLRRVVSPVLGIRERGWSFSTFELPLSDVNPAIMPDILFRLTRYTNAAPPRPRQELRVRLFEPRSPTGADDFADLASWLLAEYEERGGDGLGQLIASWQGGDKTVPPRISRIYEELRAARAPAMLPPRADKGPAEGVTQQSDDPGRSRFNFFKRS